jgi:hypothetical protein
MTDRTPPDPIERSAGARLHAAASILFANVHTMAERKLFRPDGPRVQPDQLFEYDSGDEILVVVENRAYLVELTLSCRELNPIGEDELFPSSGEVVDG